MRNDTQHHIIVITYISFNIFNIRYNLSKLEHDVPCNYSKLFVAGVYTQTDLPLWNVTWFGFRGHVRFRSFDVIMKNGTSVDFVRTINMADQKCPAKEIQSLIVRLIDIRYNFEVLSDKL